MLFKETFQYKELREVADMVYGASKTGNNTLLYILARRLYKIIDRMRDEEVEELADSIALDELEEYHRSLFRLREIYGDPCIEYIQYLVEDAMTKIRNLIRGIEKGKEERRALAEIVGEI